MAYDIRMASPALRDLETIPPRYAAAILEFIYGALAANPDRVGKRLERELTGCHSARRGDYRIIYEIHADADDVLITRINHRSSAYRTR